ncbi:N-acetylgalactosamine 6-sulfate sulfatase [Labilibacter sediminis]|nr:N-acetylgalactosamine 6-sulfate sulfatase [Labilibacter sediminis]
MNRYILIVLLPLLFAGSLFAQSQPNIILIMTDDQGWFDAGFNGNEEIKTPNLDRIAKQGIIFDRFYSGSAVCSPTRASVITGRNPNRMGIITANKGHMKEEEITIAELVKQKGYATAHFGKWHLGILTKKEIESNRGGREKNFDHFTIPTSHGYDEFFCTEAKVPTYDPMIKPKVYKDGESERYGWSAVKKGEEYEPFNTAYWIGEEQKATENLSGDDTKVIMDRVIPFIDKAVKQNKPFFTTVWAHTPHLPLVTGDYYKNMYKDLSEKDQLYYGCITALDDQIGRLWDELEQKGIADNTMIWFCSDNGPEHKTSGSTGSFRDRKRSLYEGGVRIPVFVVWKKGLKGGERTELPAFTSDYLPTIINMLDITYPDDRPMDGTDIMPFLKNKQSVRDTPMGFLLRQKMSWVSNQYKLISIDGGKTFELYDLLSDKEEKNNLIDSLPNIAETMQKDLDNWLKSVKNSNKGNDYTVK